MTVPLAVFLTLVAGVLAFAAWQRLREPTPDEAIVLLADGDLDREERQAVLEVLVEQGARSSRVAHRWAGMLAAVALERRDAFEAALDGLQGPGPGMQRPANVDLEFLDLGDPLLHNILHALLAEAQADRPAGLRRWRQVEAQCQLMNRPLAAELAAAGIQRCT